VTDQGKKPSPYEPYGPGDRSGPSPSSQADAMGATIIASLITGPAVFGALGWLLAQWLELRLLIPLGVLIGMALSLYTVWLRYGRT